MTVIPLNFYEKCRNPNQKAKSRIFFSLPIEVSLIKVLIDELNTD